MKITWSPAITLDGYIAKSDGDTSWVTDEDGKFCQKMIAQAGCYIVGRITFERDREFFDIPDHPKGYIWTSHAPKAKGEPGFTYVSGSPETVLRQIEQDGFKDVLLVGGGITNDAFVASGRVREIFVTIYPMTFGKGIKMLSKPNKLNLELQGTENIGSGIIRQHYLVK